MRSYLNRADREHHLAILVFWDYLAAWLEKQPACRRKRETHENRLHALDQDKR